MGSSEKVCIKCGLLQSTDNFYSHKQTKDRLTSWCKTCSRERSKQWHTTNSDRSRASRIAYYYADKERAKKRHDVYRENNRDKCNETARKYNKSLRELVLKEYGNKCNCCGEAYAEFLTVDHINNDGAEHRKNLGSKSMLYKWLKKNNFPKDNFQLLCMNCNFSKGMYGYCPHTTPSASVS